MKAPRFFLRAFAFLAVVPLPALCGEHLVLPEKPEWAFTGMAHGKMRPFNVPAELPAIEALPDPERKVLKARIRLIERNQAETRRVGQRFFRQPMPHRLTPDYERSLAEVAISVSYSDVAAPNPLERHLPLLRALPAYSKIHVITPTKSGPAVGRALSQEGMAERAAVHPVDGWNRAKLIVTTHTRATRWVRDTFMVGADASGKAAVFSPLAYDSIDDLANSDLAFLRNKWHDPRRIVDIPAFVRGGNVTVGDNNAGKRIVFVGGDEFERNSMYFRRSIGLAPPKELLPEALRRIAGTRELVVLPNSEGLFHIDMAISLLAPGVAALVDPVDEWELPSPDLGTLLAIRKVLPRQGFRVVRIPSTAARVKANQSPVNIVPFVDKASGRQKALVPKFPDVEVTIEGQKRSINQAIQQAYEAAGIDVVWVEDRFSDRGGNLHCALLGLH
jgi:hypothetical protein